MYAYSMRHSTQVARIAIHTYCCGIFEFLFFFLFAFTSMLSCYAYDRIGIFMQIPFTLNTTLHPHPQPIQSEQKLKKYANQDAEKQILLLP